MDRYRNLEDNIRRIGSEIDSRVAGKLPSLFDGRRWKGRIMETAMQDEDAKVRLFRFVDVLPSLGSDSKVVELFGEYFSEAQSSPAFLRRVVGRIRGEGLLPTVMARGVRAGVESFAAQFIAAQGTASAVGALESLRQDGFVISLDLLGEAVLSESEAHGYIQRYLELLDAIGPVAMSWPRNSVLDTDGSSDLPSLDVSVKVSSFFSQLDPVNWAGSVQGTADALVPVIRKADSVAASVTLDMEHYHVKDLTLDILYAVLDKLPEFSHPGIAVQAYLPDTLEDLVQLRAMLKKTGRRLAVRLVKGAYWDFETVINKQLGWPVPVLGGKEDTDAHFEELTRLLLEGREYFRPAIATHNLRSISHAMAVAESLGLPKEALEFQMIYGMAEPLRNAIRDLGYRVRIYTPIGELIPGMAYLIRRLLENTSNESFLRRSFAEGVSFEELIRAPRRSQSAAVSTGESASFRNEPWTDFSKSTNRSGMAEALQRTHNNMGRRYPLVIGGDEIFTDNETLSVNPARPTQQIGRISEASLEHADRAVTEARKAWPGWRDTPARERSEILRKAAQLMRKHRFDLMALEVYEVGKSWSEADGDVAEAIDFLNYYGLEMERLATPKTLGEYPGEANEYFYEPVGVAAVISPWNFPLAIPAGMVSAALVTGNCVIFKPSGLAPVCGWRLFELLKEAGTPEGAIQFLPGPGATVGHRLVSHPDVDLVAFTGSKEVGLEIVRLAGDTQKTQRNVKRVIAEMGGKNAIIVDDTADPDEAVKGILESALGFQGQKCSACSRVIVVGKAYSAICERLKEAMESVQIGPTENPANKVGPVIDETAREKIERYIKIGERDGKLILNRRISVQEGYFVGPAIVADAPPDSPIAVDEIFGPVVVVHKAQSIDEAIGMATSSRYALTGGLYSRSPANIEKVKREFRVGNLYINRKISGALVGRQPFGGFGMSGVGSKSGGPDYLLQFLHPRSVSENTIRRGFSPDISDAAG